MREVRLDEKLNRVLEGSEAARDCVIDEHFAPLIEKNFESNFHIHIPKEHYYKSRDDVLKYLSECKRKKHTMLIGSGTFEQAKAFQGKLPLDIRYWARARKEYLSVLDETLRDILSEEEVMERWCLIGSLTFDDARIYFLGYGLELDKEYWHFCHAYYMANKYKIKPKQHIKIPNQQ